VTFCYRNLFRRKVRTALCVLGVAIAATFVIAVGASTMRYATVIKEMNVLFNGQITVFSKDALVIQAIPISGSMMPQDSTINRLLNVSGVEGATPILFVTSANPQGILQPVPVNFSVGIPVQRWQKVLGPIVLRGNDGHFPVNDSSNEIVVGGSLADQYDWTVGTPIRVNGYDFQVSGIMNTNLALLNRCILMSLELAQKVYGYPMSINIAVVEPSAGVSLKNLTETIMQSVSYGNALTEDERNDLIQPILEQVTVWNLGIQAVVFSISLILVMTVTVMSVSERRRDFATLNAIGAPLRYVFGIVLLEAALIGVVGGAIGLAFGSLVAIGLASVYSNIPVALFFPSIFEIVPPIYLLGIFASVVGVCCAGSIVPAVSAMQMRIADVLRAEY